MGPKSNMTGVLIKWGNLETDTYSERTPWEDQGRDKVRLPSTKKQ